MVSRICISKGFGLFTEAFLNSSGPSIEFHFYGDVNNELETVEIYNYLQSPKNRDFHGFVSVKFELFSDIQVLLHVNDNEPLGRIFFEILDYGIPFIRVNNGGIGEISELINPLHKS